MKRYLDDKSRVWYDGNDDTLVIQGRDHHIIWELQHVEAAEEGDKLQLLSRVCRPHSDSAAAAQCHHTRPPKKTKITETSGLSPDTIANRLLDSVQPYLEVWRDARPHVDDSYQDIETRLQSCKAKDSSMQHLRRSLHQILSRHRQAQKESQVWSDSFEHLCHCLDICWLQTTTDEDSQSREQEEARQLVLLRHFIVNAAVRHGLDEPDALALLPLLSGKKLTYLSRANERVRSEAIDKFIKLIRPQLKKGVWYLDPIAFLAWIYNLSGLHDPVATSDSSTDIRTILGLSLLERQGFDPSAKVLHCRTPSADRRAPTSAELNPHSTAQDPQAGGNEGIASGDPAQSLDADNCRGAVGHAPRQDSVSPEPSTTYIGVSANENGFGNNQLPSPISQTRAGDPAHQRACLNTNIESDERTPPPALRPNQSSSELQPPYYDPMGLLSPSQGNVRSIGSTTLPPISSWCDFNTLDIADLPPAAETGSGTLFHDINLEDINTGGQDLSDMVKSGWNDADLEDWAHMLERMETYQ